MRGCLSCCAGGCVWWCGARSFEDAVSTAVRTSDFYTKRKPMSATINTLANALYKVFCFTGERPAVCGRLQAALATTTRVSSRPLLADARAGLSHRCEGDKAHEEMRQACFDYLSLGGMYSTGPVSLLSGLNPRPSVLVMHFFMVRSLSLSLSLSCAAWRWRGHGPSVLMRQAAL